MLLLLCVMFVLAGMGTIYLENAHKDDSVIVNWGMGITGAFSAGILTMMVGKRNEAVTHSGPTTNVVAPPSKDGAPAVLVQSNTTGSGDVKAQPPTAQ